MTDEQINAIKREAAYIVRHGVLNGAALNQCRIRGPLAGWSDREVIGAHDGLFGTSYLKLPVQKRESHG